MRPTSDTSSISRTATPMTGIPEKDQPFESLDIESLVRRCVAGDSAAFEQIVMRNERRVLNLAWRLLGNKDDAQDAAQEAFLRAFKYVHRFNTRKRIEPWLMRLTVNVCHDLGRKRQQLRMGTQIAEDMPHTPHSAVTGDPHSELALTQRKKMLRAALAELPEKERTALVLRDIEGLSTKEVADILGSSESTVRSQISTGRVKLKRVIDRKNRGPQ